MPWRTLLFKQLPGVLLAGLVGACSPQPGRPTGTARRDPARVLHLGACTASVLISSRPLKLAATPIAVRLDEGCPPDAKLIVEMDMREMPMQVAPVTLTPKGPRTYEGVVMFTMSGRWVVTLRLQTPAQAGKDSFDVDAG